MTGQPETGTLAVVQPAGRAWRVVIMVGGSRPRFLEAREVPRDQSADGHAAGEVGGPLQSLIQSHSVTRVIGVLPASSVVCRTCTLPDADPEQLEQALRLQAEVHLLGNTPEHRLAMSVLPSAPGETSRSGLVFAWPDAAPAPRVPVSASVTWAPDIAALVALLDGLRPADPLFWLDRPSGSVALAVTHAGGAIFRGTREEASTADEWRTCVSRVLAETALSVGHTGAFAEMLVRRHGDEIASVRPDDARLFVPREIIDAATRAVDDLPTDDGWWSRFGVAAGVAMAATSELAALTVLEAEDSRAKPSRIQMMRAALSRPRTALVTALVCLVTAGVLPLAISALHLGVLKLKYPEIDEQTSEIKRTRARLAMYNALDDQAWSMTKLLSDIVCNTPQGIKLEMIRLQQSDGTFAINGEVIPFDGLSATEVIATLQENLGDSRLFSEITVAWGDPNAYGHYTFDLSAKILRPHQPFDADINFDYARWTLAQREAGIDPPVDVASETDEPTAESDDTPTPATPERVADATPAVTAPRTPPAATGPAATDDTPEEEPERTASRGPRRSHGARIGSVSEGIDRASRPEDRAEGGGVVAGIVEPLTEAQVKQLSMEEISARLPKVAEARKRARKAGEGELEAKLRAEFDLLMERKRTGR